jgi:membrane protease subunit HflC
MDRGYPATRPFRPAARGALLAGAVALAALALSSAFVVDADEFGIVTAFGRPVAVIDRPGLGIKAPYEAVHRIDRRLFVYVAPPAEFLTLEKTPVVAAGTVVWRTVDARHFFETVFDRGGAEARLGELLLAELGAAIGGNPLAAFVSADPAARREDAILAAVVERARAAARRDYGIDIVDVELRRLGFPKQNRPRVYARMASERGQISMKYRSEGEEDGQKIRAVAAEERSRVLAAATLAAQRDRGLGDAEAARIFAEALAADPELYRFLRSLEAAPSLLGSDASLVLRADSPLFRLLLDRNLDAGALGVPAPPPPDRHGLAGEHAPADAR